MSLAGYLPPVIVEIVGETKGLKAAVSEAKVEMSNLQTGFTQLGEVGKVALAGIGIAAAATAYESTKLAMNFDQTMELIHTQAGASQQEVEDLKDKVLELAPAVGQSPEKLAEALYHIESTGQRGAAALDILQQSAKLASIGMADLDDVTYAMSGVMSIGMKDVNNASDAIAFMNATVGMGDMRMDALARAIGTGILPSMKSAGLGMVDFSAAIATLTDNSVPADEAATRLRMTISLMAAPSGKAADALASIGMTANQLADDMRQPNGLLIAVNDLKYHLNMATGAANYAGMTLEQKNNAVLEFADSLKTSGASADEVAAKTKLFADNLALAGDSATRQNQIVEEAFGGGRTSGAILTLLEESDKLKSKYDQLGTAADRAKTMDEAWEQQKKQAAQQWKELTARLEVYGIKIGNWLIPKVQSAITWMSEHKELMKVTAIVIGTVLVVAILAYTVAMAQAAVATIAATWPILLVIAVIAALVVGIYELVKHWSTVWRMIKNATAEAIDGIWTPLKQLGDWFAGPFAHGFMQAIRDIWDVVRPILEAIGEGIDKVIHGVEKVGSVIGDAGKGLGHMLGFAEGGIVPGPIGAPQLAIVHGGEQILSNAQLASMGRGGGVAASGSSRAGAGGGGEDIVIHQHIYLDGKEIREGQLRVARRKGQSADTLYPATVGALP